MLIVKNIFKKFHNKVILNDVSFQVKPGEIAVFLGQSGVGKSTILRILSSLETMDSGSIRLNDQPIDFKKVGMVFQDFNLFNHMTILENITLPLIQVLNIKHEQAVEIAIQMLAKFNLQDKRDVYPRQLSGGQKQRAAIARALALKPEVICLDEPTSALDPQLTAQVAKIIMQLSRENIMILIATHDIGFLQNVSSIIHLMKDGKIVQTAQLNDFKSNPSKYDLIRDFTDGIV